MDLQNHTDYRWWGVEALGYTSFFRVWATNFFRWPCWMTFFWLRLLALFCCPSGVSINDNEIISESSGRKWESVGERILEANFLLVGIKECEFSGSYRLIKHTSYKAQSLKMLWIPFLEIFLEWLSESNHLSLYIMSPLDFIKLMAILDQVIVVPVDWGGRWRWF